MKTLLAFIRNTITGGILFLIPVLLFTLLFNKAYSIIEKISDPIYRNLPEGFLSLLSSNIITIFILVLICFSAGLLFKTKFVKKWVNILEEKILISIPGYPLIKSIMSSAIGDNEAQTMKPVMVQDGDSWNLAFLVDDGEIMSTVFIPDAPRIDSGEIRIVPSLVVRKLDISVTKFNNSIKTFGKGAKDWIK